MTNTIFTKLLHVLLLVGQAALIGFLYKKDPTLAGVASVALAGGNAALPSPFKNNN